MKRIIYQVYVGNRSKLYDHCVASVADYCKEHDIEHVVQRQPILRVKPDVFATNRSKESYEKHGGFLPIFEKENAFKYLWTHDQVAIVDADIWIRPGSPNIFEKVPMEYDFGGVVEREMPCTPQYYQKITNYSRMQYSNLKQVDWKWNEYGGELFNMGMMVLNKSMAYFLKSTPSAAAFLQQAKYKDFIDGIGNWKWSTDQTLLNYWVKEERMKTKHLTFHWNGLFSAIPEERIRQANFVHFFLKDKLPARGENVKQLMEMVE